MVHTSASDIGDTANAATIRRTTILNGTTRNPCFDPLVEFLLGGPGAAPEEGYLTPAGAYANPPYQLDCWFFYPHTV